MLKRACVFMLMGAMWSHSVFAQVTDPDNPDLNPTNYDVDNMYWHVGVYFGLSQAVMIDVKHLALSGPMEHDVANTYEEMFLAAAERRGLKQYKESDILVADLFPEEYVKDKTAFIVYKHDRVLADYLALKRYKQGLVDTGRYDMDARREVAVRFGKLLSYTDERIEGYLKQRGHN